MSYVDYTSNVSLTNKSNDFVTLGSYSDSVPTVPQSSLLKLTVAAGNQKFFSAAPSFERRLDNFRIPQPASIPVSITNDVIGGSAYSQVAAAPAGDYYTLRNGAYKMNAN
jgi:hypothetical protein